MDLGRMVVPMGLTLLLVAGGAGLAAAEECRKLTTPVSGEERKYSVRAQVDGTMAFANIPCAVYWRNHELCATELSSFQFTAMVVDYPSGQEVLMSNAYYVVAAPGEKHPIAFADRQAAAAYIVQHGGELLEHQQLLTHSF